MRVGKILSWDAEILTQPYGGGYTTFVISTEAIFKKVQNRPTLIHRSNLNISIQWVPSHVNIPGNERADFLASSAHSLTFTTGMPIFHGDLSHKISLHYQTAWCRELPIIDHSFSHFNFSDKIPFSLLTNRMHQTALARLLLGTSGISHGHVLLKVYPFG